MLLTPNMIDHTDCIPFIYDDQNRPTLNRLSV